MDGYQYRIGLCGAFGRDTKPGYEVRVQNVEYRQGAVIASLNLDLIANDGSHRPMVSIGRQLMATAEPDQETFLTNVFALLKEGGNGMDKDWLRTVLSPAYLHCWLLADEQRRKS
ncbi:MAG TPA: hypothetical protein VJK52_00050 [Candidatus Nanoarchaeia archaeon]|nr:hypothetical protein [Candidatus Nanoarchaeia archaeon]